MADQPRDTPPPNRSHLDDIPTEVHLPSPWICPVCWPDGLNGDFELTELPVCPNCGAERPQ